MQVTAVIVVQVIGPYNCFLNFENLEGIRKNTVARAADALKKYAQPHTPFGADRGQQETHSASQRYK
jgi:hypothetical protein